MSKKSILISGAGPAGLATALLLDPDRYDITVLERGKTFMNMGFSIILWKTGYDIFCRSLHGTKPNNVHQIESLSFYSDEKIKKYKELDTTGIGFSVKRQDMMDQLSQVFLDKIGTDNVRFETFITDISYEGSRPIVTLNDGSVQHYDLVIDADGMHSTVRATHFTTVLKSESYKITYCWIGPGSSLKDEAIIGFMKNYLYLIQTVGDEALLAFYHHSDLKENEEFFHRLKTLISEERHAKLELKTDSMKAFMAESLHVEKSYSNRIVLVGDSFHGHTPTIGMGTSMAFEDAWELAIELNKLDFSTFDNSIVDTLQLYENRRTERVKKVYDIQELMDKLLITRSGLKVFLVKCFLFFGGYHVFKNKLIAIFRGESHASN